MRHLIVICLVIYPVLSSFGADTKVSFRSEIAPVLLDHCIACHGAKKAEGGYRVDSYEELAKPGDSGDGPLGRSQEELGELLRRVASEDASERMPADNDPLSSEQIERIKLWMEQGADFDGVNLHDPLSLVIPPAHYRDPPEVYRNAVPITAAVFSPSGSQLLVAGYHEVTVWDVATTKLVRRIKNLGQRVYAIAFDPTGQTLAVGCGEPGKSGEVRLVDFESGEILAVIARCNDVVLDVAYRPASKELAVASADSMIRIYNFESNELTRSIASHADWVTSLAWSEDGSKMISGSRDKSAKVYDAQTGELISSYLGHGAAVRGVAILSDGKQAVSTGADKKLHRWDIDGAKRVAEIAIGGEGQKIVRTENSLLVPCSDHRLLQIDLSSNSISREYQGLGDWALSVAITLKTEDTSSPTSIAAGAFNGEVRIWNAGDGSKLQSWIAKP